jgi:hypothetical protein
MRAIQLAAIPLLLLAGCATAGGDGAPAAPGAPAREQRYQATSTVLQNRAHGPELCLGAVLDSFPPQCGGLPIVNWRWDRVGGEQVASGTTWGVYRVVGTYDGASFTVVQAHLASPSAGERPTGGFESPCARPAGGWEVPDPARSSEQFLEPVRRAAHAEPDFAGMWLSYLEPMGGNVAEDPGELVLNVTFTGDLERHQTELRSLWGGRLCVARQQRSYQDLLRIQRELQGDAGAELGLRVLTTGIDEAGNRVSLSVVVLDTRARDALEARYGADAVHATAALEPVA